MMTQEISSSSNSKADSNLQTNSSLLLRPPRTSNPAHTLPKDQTRINLSHMARLRWELPHHTNNRKGKAISQIKGHNPKMEDWHHKWAIWG